MSFDDFNANLDAYMRKLAAAIQLPVCFMIDDRHNTVENRAECARYLEHITRKQFRMKARRWFTLRGLLRRP